MHLPDFSLVGDAHKNVPAGGNGVRPDPASHFEVRPACRSDALDIAKIHVRLWTASYRGSVPDTVLEEVTVERRRLFWDDVLASPTTRQQVLAVDCCGQLSGFVWYSSAASPAGSAPASAIYTVYLDPLLPSSAQGLIEDQVRKSLAGMGYSPVG